MADRSMKFTLDFAAKTAGIKDAASMADKLAAELGDSEDAGKQMAVALRIAADKAEADLASATAMAEKLGRALGPEMAAKLGQGKIDELAVRFHAAGLSVDDVDKNVDELAASIRRLDEVSNTGTQGIRDGFDRVARETDNTRSVVANFAGNAAQELPGIAGAMGPMNMAIGQFAEYASEGNIQLRNLVGAGAGLGVVAFALDRMSKNAKNAADSKAFKVSEVKAYAEAIKDAGTEVEIVRRKLEQAGKIEFRGIDKTSDVTSSFAAIGLSVDQASELIAGGSASVEAWASSIEQAGGADSGHFVKVLFTLNQQVDLFSGGSRAAAASAEFFGTKTKEAADKAAAAYEEAEAKAQGLVDAQNDLATGALDVESSIQAYQGSLDNLNTTTDDATTLVDEHSVALTDAKQSALDLAGALEEQAQKQAEAKGETWDAEASTRAQIDALTTLAAGLAPGSDLRVWLEQYIAQLDAVPAAKHTMITASGHVPGWPDGERPGGNVTQTAGGLTVNVHMPPGLAPEDVVRAIKEYEARNGKGWR